MSRRIRLMVLLIPALLLMVVTIAAVPYRIEEEYVNRRTGAISRVTVIALVSRSEPSIRQEEDLGVYGTLTARNEWLLVGKHIYPFPWSRVSMPNHWRAESHPNHWSLKMMARVLFGMAKDCRPLANEPRMTDEQFSALMGKRLDVWNTLTVDDNLQELDWQIRAENERLFPGAVKAAINTVTVTNTTPK